MTLLELMTLPPTSSQRGMMAIDDAVESLSDEAVLEAHDKYIALLLVKGGQREKLAEAWRVRAEFLADMLKPIQTPFEA